jgi:hypothetical protein
MNSEELLKKILKSESLNEYWSDIDVETINRNTLIKSNNKYLKTLHYIINDQSTGTKKVRIESIFKIFNL